jgi:hypothetical protein
MACNSCIRHLFLGLFLVAAACPGLGRAQSETLFAGIGADTRIAFSHFGLPGATGIDFRFAGAFAGAFPPEESHIVVITFEWRSSGTDPWSSSPDNAKSIPGAVTTPFDTGVYRAPVDATEVAIHFFGGGLMTVSGTFSHVSVVPEPRTAVLLVLGLAALAAWSMRERRRLLRSRSVPAASDIGFSPVRT